MTAVRDFLAHDLVVTLAGLPRGFLVKWGLHVSAVGGECVVPQGAEPLDLGASDRSKLATAPRWRPRFWLKAQGRAGQRSHDAVGALDVRDGDAMLGT